MQKNTAPFVSKNCVNSAVVKAVPTWKATANSEQSFQIVVDDEHEPFVGNTSDSSRDVVINCAY